MSHRQLTDQAFATVNAFFLTHVASETQFAVLSFKNNTTCILPAHAAVNTMHTLTRAMPCQPEHYMHVEPTAHIPTLRLLTSEEYRRHWLANFFNVSLRTIEGYCQYDPGHDIERQYNLNLTTPDAPVFQPETGNPEHYAL